MSEGFVEISEPIFYDKDEHITLNMKCNKIICILRGKFIVSDNSMIFSQGEVIDLKLVLSKDNGICDLIALDDSVIIEINNRNIEEIMKNRPGAFKEILSDTVDLINEFKIAK